MTLLAEPKLMSIDEFVALAETAGYELIEGFPTTRKPVGAFSDYVAQQVSRQLGNFCEKHDVGYVFGSQTTYRCFDNPDTARRADVSFIRKDRLLGRRIPEGYLEIPADLAVEVVSPNDLAYEVEAKVSLYLKHGFGEVWLIYPNLRTVNVYRKGEATLTFDADQTLAGRGPLEGFTCVVGQFFPASNTL